MEVFSTMYSVTWLETELEIQVTGVAMTQRVQHEAQVQGSATSVECRKCGH